MKKILCSLLIFVCALPLLAQTNAPVRLAMVGATGATDPVIDVLTAELSSRTNLQLLERNEVQKIYQEQALSAGNQDLVKLGQVLGADGLLLLSTNWETTNEFLNVRLVAVKTGVVLTAEKMSWPGDDLPGWAAGFARQLDLYLPKLAVAPKDAVPISIVNLRSAVSSTESQETERQLKLLLVQRLTREPTIFVLERQQLQLLGEEKELKSDDTAFWNGSYLLEGVADQNGYSPDTITLDARLTPKNGAPILLAVSGSRTNLPDVINQLALKVNAALNLHSDTGQWNTADEAAQYLAEAKWALRWSAFAESQSAADSAWFLGKQNLECALIRVKSCVLDLDARTEHFQKGTIFTTGANEHGIEEDMQYASARSLVTVFDRKKDQINYANIQHLPDSDNIDRAIHALDLYYEFSRNNPENYPKITTRGPSWGDWHNSDWYNLGLADLVVASRVLQGFDLVPQSQAPVQEKLRELRVMARSVADLISTAPSIHDSYYVGNRLVDHDEFIYTMEGDNIFGCELAWGCFWQETPEADVELYRQLMKSPVFCYIHHQFWRRQPEQALLAAWDDAGRRRIPVVWNNFVKELDDSTNVLFRMEGESLGVIEAKNDSAEAANFKLLMDDIISNRTDLVGNNVELFYMDWGAEELLFPSRESYTLTPFLNSMVDQWNTNYSPILDSMDQEYWRKIIPARQTASATEKQKAYLRAMTPFDFMNFVEVFREQNYTRNQAMELKPLADVYASNLVAQSVNSHGQQKGLLIGAISQVRFLQIHLNGILNPPPSSPSATVAPAIPVHNSPPTAPPVEVASPVPALPPMIETNVMVVDKFLPFPLDDLRQSIGAVGPQISTVKIIAHHWVGNKLLLILKYDFMSGGSWSGKAIAIFDPAAEHWEVINCPPPEITRENRRYNQATLWQGELLESDDGQIQKYDRTSSQWRSLPVSDGVNYELFTVNEHLYAANENIIFEIVDSGKSTRILASTRRQPPVSVLDTQVLGRPVLFEGPGHALRVSAAGKIFTWTNADWQEESIAPPATYPPEIVPDGILYRRAFDGFSEPMDASFLPTDSRTSELCLWQKIPSPNNVQIFRQQTKFVPEPKALWKVPPGMYLSSLAITRYESNLYLLADHSESHWVNDSQYMSGYQKIEDKNGYNATLYCYCRDVLLPRKLYLKFAATGGCPPATGADPLKPRLLASPPSWMLLTSNYLFCGLETPDDFSMGTQNNPDEYAYQAGIWELPLNKIRSAVDEYKKNQTAQMMAVATAQKKVRLALLAKYDLNHNGVLDPEEKERALGDPTFIESELDVIDANHNDRLDASELVYFDANHDKILEPAEQAGIEIAQHLLAKRWMKKFDGVGDGLLDSSEFNLLLQNIPDLNTLLKNTRNGTFPDINHDGRIDVNELASFLQQQTMLDLRLAGVLTAGFFKQLPVTPGQPLDNKTIFKSMVEYYWNNPTSHQSAPSAP